MARLSADNWKALALRGAITLVVGVVFVVQPLLLLQLLVVGFGGYAVLNGLVVVLGSLRARQQQDQRFRWLAVVQGAVSIAAGLALLVWPGATLLVLRVIIALWAIVTGGLDLLAAARLRSRLQGSVQAGQVDAVWLQALSGGLTLLFGLVLLPWLDAGDDVLTWTIVGYAFLEGATLLALAWALRRQSDRRQ
jgi:uncharacterized membrane protein HdeD (DUF308 family)